MKEKERVFITMLSRLNTILKRNRLLTLKYQVLNQSPTPLPCFKYNIFAPTVLGWQHAT